MHRYNNSLQHTETTEYITYNSLEFEPIVDTGLAYVPAKSENSHNNLNNLMEYQPRHLKQDFFNIVWSFEIKKNTVTQNSK